MGVGVQRHSPAVLPPGKTRYPLYRRLGGPQGKSGRVRKISPPSGFDPRTVQSVPILYADWALAVRCFKNVNTFFCRLNILFILCFRITHAVTSSNVVSLCAAQLNTTVNSAQTPKPRQFRTDQSVHSSNYFSQLAWASTRLRRQRRHPSGGVEPSLGKHPQPYLWAVSRTARVKIAPHAMYTCGLKWYLGGGQRNSATRAFGSAFLRWILRVFGNNVEDVSLREVMQHGYMIWRLQNWYSSTYEMG